MNKRQSPEATVTLVPIWKRGILKSLVYHVLNFKSWIYDKIIYILNEFNPTFETQNMGNKAFKNPSFGNASFGNGSEDYSCLLAKSTLSLTRKYPLHGYFLAKDTL